jgi:hypothetical protein
MGVDEHECRKKLPKLKASLRGSKHVFVVLSEVGVHRHGLMTANEQS